MTLRFDFMVESKIKEAIEKGEFKNLPGFGKPLDLEFMNQPAHIRIATTIMKNANVLPEELEIRKEVFGLRQKLKEIKDPLERKAVLKKILDKSTRYNILMERKGIQSSL